MGPNNNYNLVTLAIVNDDSATANTNFIIIGLIIIIFIAIVLTLLKNNK